MHEIKFADSCRPKRVACLGLPLRAYSLGHELILLSERNLFLCSDNPDAESLEDRCQALQRAADTCSMSWSEINFEACNWRERWKQARVYRQWARHLIGCDFLKDMGIFKGYLKSGRDLLPVLSSGVAEDAEAFEIANKGEKMGSGRALGAPLIAQLITFSMGTLRMSHEEAMDAPFAMTGNLYFAALESAGNLSVENLAEAEVRQRMASERATAKAEKDAARAAWTVAQTDEQRMVVLKLHPKIGNIFAEEWNAAKSDEEKAVIESKYPLVAAQVLSAAGLKPVLQSEQEEKCRE